MDGTQEKIVNALHSTKVWLDDRSILKGILSDIIPSDKIHINLMLTAYDEDILEVFKDKDATLRLLQLIQKIEDGYGISHGNACWSVATWCYVNLRDDIGDYIASINCKKTEALGDESGEDDDELLGKTLNKKYRVKDHGVYKVGVDIAKGEYKISVKWKDDNPKNSFGYAIEENPNDLYCCNYYRDQVYLMIDDGQYLEFKVRDIDKYESAYFTRVSDVVRIEEDEDDY